jgi:hypothetical protein
MARRIAGKMKKGAHQGLLDALMDMIQKFTK